MCRGATELVNKISVYSTKEVGLVYGEEKGKADESSILCWD